MVRLNPTSLPDAKKTSILAQSIIEKYKNTPAILFDKMERLIYRERSKKPRQHKYNRSKGGSHRWQLIN